MLEPLENFEAAEKIASAFQDEIKKLEKKRRDHLLFLAIFPLLLSLPVIPVSYFSLFYITGTPVPVSIAWLVGYITLLAYGIWTFDADYRKKTKHDFLYIIAECLGLKYRRGGFITLGDLYDHHVLPPYGQSLSEEGFSGRIRNIDFQFQDFHVEPVFRADWPDYRSILSYGYFYGVAIRIDIGKYLKHHTILMPRFMANGAIKRHAHEKFLEHKDINLVYPKFKRTHTVLSTDQVEARYVLDPAMIERIMSVADLLSAPWLEISFKGSEIVIIASQKENFFEISHLFRPVTVLTIEKTLGQITRIESAIRAFELNPLTGLGR